MATETAKTTTLLPSTKAPSRINRNHSMKKISRYLKNLFISSSTPPKTNLTLPYLQDCFARFGTTFCQPFIINSGTLYLNRHNHLQKLTPNTLEEKTLLTLSKSLFFKREVTQIKLLSPCGECLYQAIHKGSRNKGASLKYLQEKIKEGQKHAADNLLTVASIEIAHTHPFIESITKTMEKITWKINGLGAQDLYLGERISSFLSIPLTLKAIVENGHHYQVTFKQSQTTRPLK
jgi:hypothetical protein